MTPPKIKPEDGRDAVEKVLASLGTPLATPDVTHNCRVSVEPASRDQLALAVRYLLQRFEQDNPGQTVEVRVPPFGAVQAVDGPRHTRGTPPNVVELAPGEWVALATGHESWDSLIASGRISASGTRSNISALLPLAEW